MQKEMSFDLSKDKEVDLVAQALSSGIRRRILNLLRKGSYTINEISTLLNLPISTTSFHISLLRKAQMVNIIVKAGARGSAKVVSRRCDVLKIGFDDLELDADEKQKTVSMSIPVGSYTEVQAANICGIANDKEIIGVDDMPGAFYHPKRTEAGLLWFSRGYVEYRLPNYYLYGHEVRAFNFNLEICSEAPNFDMKWPSDITFWVNSKEICTYTSPGDFGDRRGILTPRWWSDYSTQYGLLKNIKVDRTGVYVDADRAGETTVGELELDKNTYITLRIGIKDDARHKGGLNLFGKTFGDYPQDIVVRVNYV